VAGQAGLTALGGSDPEAAGALPRAALLPGRPGQRPAAADELTHDIGPARLECHGHAAGEIPVLFVAEVVSHVGHQDEIKAVPAEVVGQRVVRR
jgi:hypothetical protein